jgi:hypothetical protein
VHPEALSCQFSSRRGLNGKPLSVLDPYLIIFLYASTSWWAASLNNAKAKGPLADQERYRCLDRIYEIKQCLILRIFG